MQPVFLSKIKNSSKNQHIAENLIPSGIKSNSEKMLLLLNKFSEYLNQQSNSQYLIDNILKNKDIDRVDDEFIGYLENEIANDVPKDFDGNKSSIYKNLISFYRTKGSIDCIKDFFRIFYGEKIEVFLPKKYVFNTSDGTRSKTSDLSKILDSNYYQDFSYVIKTSLNSEVWRDKLLKVAHPAGYSVFGEILLNIDVNPNQKGTLLDTNFLNKGVVPNSITGLLDTVVPEIIINIKVPKNTLVHDFFINVILNSSCNNYSFEKTNTLNKVRNKFYDDTPLGAFGDITISNFFANIIKPLPSINFQTISPTYSLDSLNTTLKSNILYSFHVKDAQESGGIIYGIPEETYKEISLLQADSTKRPSLTSGKIVLSNTNTVNKGLYTSSTISFNELFIVGDFASGTKSTFPDISTLISGTGVNGTKRICGSTGTNNLLTTSSLEALGKIRINNSAERNTAILPLNKSVIHTVVDSFTTPILYSDIITIGYNSFFTNRAWEGNLYQIIFTKPLDETQRTTLVNHLKTIHSIP